MEFSHYSAEPFEFDNTHVYEQESDGGFGKPHGFWLSVDGPADWKEWCESNEWRMGALTTRTAFTVSPDANVRLITNHDELVAFDAEYGSSARFSDTLRTIDWVRVANDYDGIIIAPYLWSARLDFSLFWYYGWDCASGCFWNLKMIEPVKVDA
jgi:hypothetical protein